MQNMQQKDYLENFPIPKTNLMVSNSLSKSIIIDYIELRHNIERIGKSRKRYQAQISNSS
jgi:hypothetical protein